MHACMHNCLAARVVLSPDRAFYNFKALKHIDRRILRLSETVDQWILRLWNGDFFGRAVLIACICFSPSRDDFSRTQDHLYSAASEICHEIHADIFLSFFLFFLSFLSSHITEHHFKNLAFIEVQNILPSRHGFSNHDIIEQDDRMDILAQSLPFSAFLWCPKLRKLLVGFRRIGRRAARPPSFIGPRRKIKSRKRSRDRDGEINNPSSLCQSRSIDGQAEFRGFSVGFRYRATTKKVGR